MRKYADIAKEEVTVVRPDDESLLEYLRRIGKVSPAQTPPARPKSE